MSEFLKFNLDKLYYFTSTKLFSQPDRTDEDSVILSLAQAYNDLKGLLLFYEVMQEQASTIKKDAEVVNAKRGQISGIVWQLNRYIIGVLEEIVCLLDEHKNTLKLKNISSAVEKLDSDIQAHWATLVSFTDATPISNPQINNLRKLIIQIRGNSAFHYHQPKALVKGYKEAMKPTGYSKGRAYYCFGDTMEKIRFNFADAATEAYIQSMGEQGFNEDVKNFIRIANVSIALLVRQYLKQIQCDIHCLGNANEIYENKA